MRFVMNGLAVFMRRLEYEDGAGHILQFKVLGEGDEAVELAQKITTALESVGEGVMSNVESSDSKPLEIRSLNGLELPSLLAILAQGVGVVQAE